MCREPELLLPHSLLLLRKREESEAHGKEERKPRSVVWFGMSLSLSLSSVSRCDWGVKRMAPDKVGRGGKWTYGYSPFADGRKPTVSCVDLGILTCARHEVVRGLADFEV